jgi:hypothetical protein
MKVLYGENLCNTESDIIFPLFCSLVDHIAWTRTLAVKTLYINMLVDQLLYALRGGLRTALVFVHSNEEWTKLMLG